MAKYIIEITEILQKQIFIDAENIEESLLIAKELYQNQKIILDEKNHIETHFEAIE
ncbi:MAG: DpnD/PcfM family protein [Roseburia sp.]|nr:DpnD/PcfM family protein [Anaeroplasma bactoclasticum]MCM1196912.1 DpnD/PcfM family protein [Roseburia sp.]MCM1556469.1 DpnD/PcfM family protein [Anaeroplasma bactoclasticum]